MDTNPTTSQTPSPGASALKLKTSLKAGVKTCRNAAECADPNHNQTASAAGGLKLKTSLKAGIKSCVRNCTDPDTNHNQSASPAARA